jgi:hypothetical protein
LISSAALFLLAHFLSSPSVPPGKTGGAIAASWSADLRPAIGSAPLGLVVGRGHETLLPIKSLWFQDNSTVVATFVTREEKHTALSKRDQSDANLPLRLCAIFIDVSTRKVTSTQSWPTESRFARIVAVNNGNVITQRGDLLTLYSSDARELRRLSLPPVAPDYLTGWFPHASPTGSNILFATPNPRETSPRPWIWVNASTLEIARSWKEVQSGGVAISDTTISMIACGFYPYRCKQNVEVKSLTTEWKTIAAEEGRPGFAPWLSEDTLFRFLNEDTIFLSGNPWKLLKPDGTVVLRGDTPLEGSMAITSSTGQRFVVPFFQWKGGVAALDIGAHGELKAISIYDAPFHEQSYRLEVKGPKIREQVKLALSPDGSKLAILYDESIYLFQLPPQLPAPATPPPSKADGAAHRE